MSTIWIRDFKRGLDARRLPETAEPDVLIHGVNGHITRGGEFEKRKAFVPTYGLPPFDTVNLAARSDGLYVFGSATPLGMPAGVKFRRLQHFPRTMTRIVSWDLFQDEIYAVAEFSDGFLGHYYGTASINRSGRAASTSITVVSGQPGDTIDIKVAGVSATGGPVAWAGSAIATATALANAINATASSPDFTATTLFFSPLFTLSAATVGPASNGLSVVATVTGTPPVVQIGNAGTLANGITPYVGNTRYVRTIGTKIYTLSGPNLQFSSIGDPTDWDGQLGGTGFGTIDTSSYTAGAEDLTAIVEYGDKAAVFSQRTIQIWNLQADPADNSFVKVLRNTGTSCPRSIT